MNPPRCAVCCRPVERIEEQRDDFMRRVRYLVRCHGDVQSVDLSFDELERLDGLAFGEAFAGQRLLT